MAALQRLQETEKEFATRLESYAEVRSCVFIELLLVHYFLHELLPTTAVIVAAQIHRLPLMDRV